MTESMLKFVKDLIYDTLYINFNYFKCPYEDLSDIDRKLRCSLKNTHTLYNEFKEFIDSLEYGHYYYITDNMKINYIVFFPREESRDFIALGPFFKEKPNEKYLNEISKLNDLSKNDLEVIRGFLYGIAVIENNFQLISTMTHIHKYFNPDCEPFSIKYVNLNEGKAEEFKMNPHEEFDAFEKAVCRRYECENVLLGYIAKGNYEMASYEGRKFISYPCEPNNKSPLRDIKTHMCAANTLFRKTAESTKVHAFYLHRISSKFANLIENATSEKDLNNIYDKMIREYCTLVKTKSMNQYSSVVRDLIHFIDFNLNLPLTLETLAEKYELSVPYLSTLFKKEVGTTIIAYINKQRIETACKLLTTTSMTIQDVSAAVGILDSNYFTRLFKKETGYSPRKYRQMKEV